MPATPRPPLPSSGRRGTPSAAASCSAPKRHSTPSRTVSRRAWSRMSYWPPRRPPWLARPLTRTGLPGSTVVSTSKHSSRCLCRHRLVELVAPHPFLLGVVVLGPALFLLLCENDLAPTAPVLDLSSPVAFFIFIVRAPALRTQGAPILAIAHAILAMMSDGLSILANVERSSWP